MNFSRYCALDEQYGLDACRYLEEVMNTNDLEKELGMYRSTIRKITVRVIGKFYKALMSTPNMTPFEAVLSIISYLQANGDGSFEEVAKIVTHELPPDAKKEFIESLKAKYPNGDYSKFGVK